MFYGAHLYVFAVSKTMFCHINQYITKVIADYENVFSIQYSVFFAVVFIRYIDSILYINIYINI